MQRTAVQNLFPADADQLFSLLKTQYGFRYDADLARLLHVSTPTISRLRKGTASMTAGIILRIHELTGIPVAEIRALSGTPPEWEE